METNAITPSEPNALAPINPESILIAALDKGVAVETMERLLAMREQLQKEQARRSFFASLAKFQAECPVIVKDRDVMNKDGRSVRYRYAPMESIVRQIGPLLAECGFSYSFTTESDEKSVTVRCHASHRDGHAETTAFHSNIDPTAYMNLAQKFGSALTFGKRYALCNAFGIVTGDEDDDSLSSNPQPGEKGARETLEKIKRQRKQQQREETPDTPLEASDGEHEELTEEDMTHLDFLNGIAEETDCDAITLMAKQSNEFPEGPKRDTAKKAIMERAKTLGLVWDRRTSEFVKGGQGE